MLFIVLSDKYLALAIPLKSPCSKVTPALSIATSVPVPIAIPTSAFASAGASFTPSPAIATIKPFPFNSLTIRPLSSGIISAMTFFMPRVAATASAVFLLSPVSM